MYFRSEFDLDPSLAGFDPVSRPVVQRYPIREYIVGIESLYEEKSLIDRGKPFFSLDLAHLRLQPRPTRDVLCQFDAGQKVLFIRQVRGVNSDGCYTSVEHGGDLHTRLFHIRVSLDAVMVGVDGHRDCDMQLVGNGINQAGQVPEVHGAVCSGAAFRFCDLHNDSRIGSLGRLQSSTNNELVASVGSDGHGPALGDHGPVNNLAADEERLGVGEQLYDAGWPPSFKGFCKILQRNSCHG